MTTKEYEEDEFDRAAGTQPAGAHRQPVSRLKLAWPFLVVIIAAPVLAWIIVTVVLGGGDTSDASSTPPATTQAPQAPATPEVNKATPVTINNAAGVQGLAASAAGKLTDNGFTSINPTNSAARGISHTTVYYSSENHKAAAEAVAKILGIQAVEATPAGYQMPDGVAVYLLSDYSPSSAR
ncbi:LytR C-terminal domain-containing protein [Nanchangia anserum]|uniref:LytR C-terminal domain-containing protein n=1 Tax=Nanchangia anserum TaxID=2692125 RepID=A0A8I0KQI8_9ACTO|nr:LytR C-terminal domain-containing protein [Nanchangia anserum]MBD3690035.1 LytR C-terminal domain-containing protein [Nanchangia anserum]QOX82169.1 LytR C-terminal domain-containing protein [Nanchangia anserum]